MIKWTLPLAGMQFEKSFKIAEANEGLPPGLLGRVAYQESRFRPDIISGETQSGAGAQGLMQIVPKWHPDVDPLNPIDAINYSAKYLRKLYDQFGDWRYALAAYNWGPGNLKKYLNDPANIRIPKETADYVSQIGADVGLI